MTEKFEFKSKIVDLMKNKIKYTLLVILKSCVFYSIRKDRYKKKRKTLI